MPNETRYFGRCYACDVLAHLEDGDTGRSYCRTCWTAIEIAIGRKSDDDYQVDDDETLEQFIERNFGNERKKKSIGYSSDLSEVWS